MKLVGEEHRLTLLAANNCVHCLVKIERYEEAKALARKTMPVARRVFGEGHDLPLRLSWNYTRALCEDRGATPDDYRETVAMLEDTAPTARRVLGGAHPLTVDIERYLRLARTALRIGEARRHV